MRQEKHCNGERRQQHGSYQVSGCDGEGVRVRVCGCEDVRVCGCEGVRGIGKQWSHRSVLRLSGHQDVRACGSSSTAESFNTNPWHSLNSCDFFWKLREKFPLMYIMFFFFFLKNFFVFSGLQYYSWFLVLTEMCCFFSTSQFFNLLWAFFSNSYLRVISIRCANDFCHIYTSYSLIYHIH